MSLRIAGLLVFSICLTISHFSFAIYSDTGDELPPNYEKQSHDDPRYAEIFKELDRTGINGHFWTAIKLRAHYPSETLARACVGYLRGAGFMADGKRAAALILLKLYRSRYGDQGLLDLFFSGQTDLSHMALDRIQGRLGGIRGFLRNVIGIGAPKAYRNLGPEEKQELATAILRSTGIFMQAMTAGMVESLGTSAELASLAESYRGRVDGKRAAQRLYQGFVSSAVNTCALLLSPMRSN